MLPAGACGNPAGAGAPADALALPHAGGGAP